MSVDLQWLWDALAPFVPPAMGGLVGLRYAKEPRPKRDRIISWGLSVGAGIYLGAALGEFYGLGIKTVGGAMFVIAMLSAELFGVVVAALRQWQTDPAGTFRRWLDAWFGRGGQ